MHSVKLIYLHLISWTWPELTLHKSRDLCLFALDKPPACKLCLAASRDWGNVYRMNGWVLMLLPHPMITKRLWHVVVRLRMQNWKCLTNRIIATLMFYITSLLHSQREAVLFVFKFNSNVPWKFMDNFRAKKYSIGTFKVISIQCVVW